MEVRRMTGAKENERSFLVKEVFTKSEVEVATVQ